jgi:predicted TIM-barrel fold metal-dependent hydrolase
MDAQAGFSIVDALCTPGPFSTRQPDQPCTMADLMAEHARFGIRQRLCLHAESRDGVPDEGNAEMDRLAGEHPGTGAIWTVLPPRRLHAEPVESLIDRARKSGVAAFVLFPKRQSHHFAPWANGPLYAAMEEAKLPLYVDASQIEWRDLYDVARAYPRLPIVVWYAGYRTDRYLIPIMDECENLRIGLAPTFVQSDCIEDFTGRYGPTRLIFGSGWPTQSPGPLITLVTYSTVDDATKSAILSGNINRLVSDVSWPVKGLESTNTHG